MKNIKTLLNKTSFKVKKYSPEILMGVGIAGVVASTVLACKATMKVDSVLTESKEQIEKIKSVMEDPKYTEEYTEEDAKKDLTIVYTQAGLKLAKMYVPSIVVGAASIGLLIGSHRVLKKRNIALAAAYTTIDNTFKDYRKRVTDRFGEEVERQIKNNIKVMDVAKTTIDEDGNEVEQVEQVEVSALDGYSEYSRFFDDGCTGWEKDAEYNLMFLRAQQQYANDLLKSRGHLFLNEVYDMLGIPRTKAGQAVGWIYDPENPVGDNYVDFGIYDINKEKSRDFVNGYERTILLDFNVDGNIWDLM